MENVFFTAAGLVLTMAGWFAAGWFAAAESKAAVATTKVAGTLVAISGGILLTCIFGAMWLNATVSDHDAHQGIAVLSSFAYTFFILVMLGTGVFAKTRHSRHIP
jgi:hypothetical protein